MKEKTLVLIKPDAVQRALIGEILSRFERTGLKVIAMKMAYASKELAGKHYADDDEWLKSVGDKASKAAQERGEKLKETPIQFGKKIRRQLMDYISMSPVVALVLEGHNAVATVRKIVGPTSPEHANPGTIRGPWPAGRMEDWKDGRTNVGMASPPSSLPIFQPSNLPIFHSSDAPLLPLDNPRWSVAIMTHDDACHPLREPVQDVPGQAARGGSARAGP